MTSRPKYNQYLTSNRRQVPAGINFWPASDFNKLHIYHQFSRVYNAFELLVDSIKPNLAKVYGRALGPGIFFF